MRDDAISRSVRNYNLFGEASDLPDVVHCETIEERSLLHDWEFEPHRHSRLHQLLLVERGTGKADLDGDRLELSNGTFLNIPRGTVHGFRFTPGTSGFVLSVASEALDHMLENSEWLHQVLAQPSRLSATTAMNETMHAIFAEYAGREFARAQMLRSLCGALFGLTARLLSESGAGPQTAETHPILERFEELLELHFSDRWTVSDYARELAVTPTHLTRIVRQAAGKPATRLIEERLVQEARRHLVYTNLPVSTVAYSLGFADPAYFSRVFRRATGYSPAGFRDRIAEAKYAAPLEQFRF